MHIVDCDLNISTNNSCPKFKFSNFKMKLFNEQEGGNFLLYILRNMSVHMSMINAKENKRFTIVKIWHKIKYPTDKQKVT